MLIDFADKVFLREIVGNPFLQFPLVSIVVEQHSVGFLSVTSSTTCLLEIGLDAVRTVDVNHKPHIWFVDTHAESIRCHHHSDLILLPGLLALVFLYTVQSCMVECGCYACLLDQVGYFFRAPPATDIHDGRAPQTAKDMDKFFLLVLRSSHDICQVLSFEAHTEDPLLIE